MNIVNSGERYNIYGEEVKTYKELPVGTYQVQFSKMQGFYLTKHEDLTANEKSYGSQIKKVDKILKTFSAMSRNMGVILSGPKGIGKSMFARQLAKSGNAKGLPLIIISNNFPGIPDFISSIKQECIVLFDEFEKVYMGGDRAEVDDQDQLLPLFDGIDNGKKLYVITCNRTRNLNEYLLNRPGRFHYHLELTAPTPEEIREYLEDNLVDDAKKHIDKIIGMGATNTITYDVLRAISFELNQGYDLAETMQDLNITRDRRIKLDIRLTFSNGIYAEFKGYDMDMLNDKNINPVLIIPTNILPFDLETNADCCRIYINAHTSDLHYTNTGYSLDMDDVIWNWDSDYKYVREAVKDAVAAFVESCKDPKITIKTSKSAYNWDNDLKYLF